MNKIVAVAVCGLQFAVCAQTVQPSYLMVYHKDCDHSLHMAVSDDSYNWRVVRDGDKPVVDGKEIAEQKGIRDPHIFRAPDGTYIITATDLHLFGQREGLRETEWEREGRAFGWGNNRDLVLLKSRDLISWEKHKIFFTEIDGPTYARKRDGSDYAWSELGCVWAPEVVWDEGAKKAFIHFTVRFGNSTTRIYAAHLNESMTGLDEVPRPLLVPPMGWDLQPIYGILDSDIVKDDNGEYHMFYVSHQWVATIKHAVSKRLTGPYKSDEWFADGIKHGHEAPNVWRRPDGTWVLMWDRYTMKPHNFGFHESKDLKGFKMIGYFDGGEMKRTGFSEQKHGGVVAVPREDVERLEAYWKGK